MLSDQEHRAPAPRRSPVSLHILRAVRVSRVHATVCLHRVYDCARLLILPSNSIVCL